MRHSVAERDVVGMIEERWKKRNERGRETEREREGAGNIKEQNERGNVVPREEAKEKIEINKERNNN